jgi:hypothetical protein
MASRRLRHGVVSLVQDEARLRGEVDARRAEDVDEPCDAFAEVLRRVDDASRNDGDRGALRVGLVTRICAALDASKHLIPWQGSRPLPIERIVNNTPEAPLDVRLHASAERY